MAELLAGPRPRHQRPAVGARRRPIEHRLVRIDDPILRVPQLAIHLAEDRKAVKLDPQRHVNAVWGVGAGARSFLGYVAEQAGVDEDDVLGADLMTHDLTPSTLAGVAGELVSAPRLDNQATCYAGLEAFWPPSRADTCRVLALFDHEEVGSQSDHGAQSELLPTVLERIALAAGGGREDFLRGWPGRWWRRATWRTPPTRTIPSATSPATSSRSTPAGAQGAAQPALRHRRPHRGGVRAGVCAGRACRCSATSTAPTCRAGRRSGR